MSKITEIEQADEELKKVCEQIIMFHIQGINVHEIVFRLKVKKEVVDYCLKHKNEFLDIP